MRQTTFLAIGLLALPTAALAADDHAVVAPDHVKWVAAPPAFPKGAQLAVVSGTPPKRACTSSASKYRLVTKALSKHPPK